MSTNKITYYFDALCGWCFGFTDVMEQVFQKYGNEIEFEVVSGGLFLGERVGKINDVAPYIKAGAFRSVEQTTGVKFGKDFLENALENNSMEMNSIYPAIALAIVKEVAPKKKMEYASTLLKAFYVDGISADDVEKYAGYAEKIGIDTTDFTTKMKDEKYLLKAREDFSICASQGVRGYPAVIFTKADESYLLTNGFSNFENMNRKIKMLTK